MSQLKRDLTKLGGSFSKLLSHAVLDVVPGCALACDWVMGHYVSAQYVLWMPHDQIDLAAIEQRLHQLILSQPELKVMEMVPRCAMELLKSKDQKYLAASLKNIENQTLELVSFGPYVDLCRYGIDQFSDKLAFQLLDYEIKQDKQKLFLFVRGAFAEDQKQLKAILKTERQLQKFNHINLNQFLPLVDSNYLYPAAVYSLNQLKQVISDAFQEAGLQPLIALDETAHPALPKDSNYFLWQSCQEAAFNPLLKGLFATPKKIFDCWQWVTNEANLLTTLISCLNFYSKTIKILGFSCQLKYLKGSSPKLQRYFEQALLSCPIPYQEKPSPFFGVKFEMVDQYDRVLLSPSWKIEPYSSLEGKLQYAVTGTFCHSLETLLGLVLEHYELKLPLKWSPLQLKILTSKESHKYGLELLSYFKQHGLQVQLDCSHHKLNTKLHQAYKQQVPYIVIVGEKEEQSQMLTVKYSRLNQQEQRSKEELLKEIQTEQRKEFEV